MGNGLGRVDIDHNDRRGSLSQHTTQKGPTVGKAEDVDVDARKAGEIVQPYCGYKSLPRSRLPGLTHLTRPQPPAKTYVVQGNPLVVPVSCQRGWDLGAQPSSQDHPRRQETQSRAHK